MALHHDDRDEDDRAKEGEPTEDNRHDHERRLRNKGKAGDMIIENLPGIVQSLDDLQKGQDQLKAQLDDILPQLPTRRWIAATLGRLAVVASDFLEPQDEDGEQPEDDAGPPVGVAGEDIEHDDEDGEHDDSDGDTVPLAERRKKRQELTSKSQPKGKGAEPGEQDIKRTICGTVGKTPEGNLDLIIITEDASRPVREARKNSTYGHRPDAPPPPPPTTATRSRAGAQVLKSSSSTAVTESEAQLHVESDDEAEVEPVRRPAAPTRGGSRRPQRLPRAPLPEGENIDVARPTAAGRHGSESIEDTRVVGEDVERSKTARKEKDLEEAQKWRDTEGIRRVNDYVVPPVTDDGRNREPGTEDKKRSRTDADDGDVSRPSKKTKAGPKTKRAGGKDPWLPLGYHFPRYDYEHKR